MNRNARDLDDAANALLCRGCQPVLQVMKLGTGTGRRRTLDSSERANILNAIPGDIEAACSVRMDAVDGGVDGGVLLSVWNR